MSVDEPLLPVDPAAADFCADRRRLDGTRSFWATSKTERAVRLTRWDLVGQRWSIAGEADAPSWLDAVQNDAELIAVRAEEVTEYEAPDPASALEVLVCAGDGDPAEEDWPFDVQDYEDENDGFWISEGVLRRYARVGGQRVYFAESAPRPLPFLVTAGGAVDGAQLADFLAGSEAGRTSGAGGWELFQVRPGAAVAVPTGDTAGNEGAVRGFRDDPTPEGTARMIAAWLTHAEDYCSGMKGSTALALEPLDPAGLLSQEQRAAWQEELDSLRGGFGETSKMTFLVSSEITNELRRILSAQDSTYAKIRDALADPIKGDWLRESFADGDLEPLW